MAQLDRKLLYRTIVMLQSFRSCYMAYVHHRTDGTRLFECKKLVKMPDGTQQKFTCFALSKEPLPEFKDIGDIVFYEVNLLNDSQIKQYISQCLSYGILDCDFESQYPSKGVFY